MSTSGVGRPNRVVSGSCSSAHFCDGLDVQFVSSGKLACRLFRHLEFDSNSRMLCGLSHEYQQPKYILLIRVQ